MINDTKGIKYNKELRNYNIQQNLDFWLGAKYFQLLNEKIIDISDEKIISRTFTQECLYKL